MSLQNTSVGKPTRIQNQSPHSRSDLPISLSPPNSSDDELMVRNVKNENESKEASLLDLSSKKRSVEEVNSIPPGSTLECGKIKSGKDS